MGPRELEGTFGGGGNLEELWSVRSGKHLDKDKPGNGVRT